MKKILTYGLHAKGGRNNGRISVTKRGSLVKRNYRFLDSKRTAFAKYPLIIIKKNIYDPNRSGKISLVIYPSGILTYVLEAEYTLTQKFIYNLHVPKNIKEKGWSNYIRKIH